MTSHLCWVSCVAGYGSSAPRWIDRSFDRQWRLVCGCTSSVEDYRGLCRPFVCNTHWRELVAPLWVAPCIEDSVGRSFHTSAGVSDLSAPLVSLRPTAPLLLILCSKCWTGNVIWYIQLTILIYRRQWNTIYPPIVYVKALFAAKNELRTSRGDRSMLNLGYVAPLSSTPTTDVSSITSSVPYNV